MLKVVVSISVVSVVVKVVVSISVVAVVVEATC